MSDYPVLKLLALSQAARAVQHDPTPEAIAHFEALLAAMGDPVGGGDDGPAESVIPLHGAALRSRSDLDGGRLGAGDSRVFSLTPLLISLYRDDSPDSLTLQGNIAGDGWHNAIAMLYQQSILIDSDLIDERGDFTLTAIEIGSVEVHLRAVNGELIRLTGIDLA